MWKRDVFPSVPSPERPGTPLGEIVTSFLLSLLTSSFLEIARNNTSKTTNNLTMETGSEKGPIPSQTAAQPGRAWERLSPTWFIQWLSPRWRVSHSRGV